MKVTPQTIENARLHYRLTYEALAAETGLSVSLLNLYASGNYKSKLNRLSQFALERFLEGHPVPEQSMVGCEGESGAGR